MPINGHSIVNSDLVLELKNLPKTMIVVGGGVIGVEYTCMFSALGVRVTAENSFTSSRTEARSSIGSSFSSGTARA